ncbi:DUF423 domain-containing protein [Litoribacillus peritrichatus]|uniref:DUF423 domain-containing protein n=2 Tax=Litoribacillus peritrichatus TaxID=718191 RepID=A0ABP7MNB3_9GAMM
MNYLMISAISGFLAVSMGAFGAHALKTLLTPEYVAVYQTAAHYHLTHSIVLALVAVLMTRYQTLKILKAAACSFLVGIILFSGSLYTLAVTGVKPVGAITPIGGVALLIGWGCLAAAGLRISKSSVDVGGEK